MRTVDGDYDVVVCGGGLAGFSAAVSAARHGANTALIHDRPVLGGNSSSEVRVPVHGAAAVHAYARETGVVGEALVHERLINHASIKENENGWTNSNWDLVLYDIAMRTPNLTLYLNTTVEDVDVAQHRITSVAARVANAETMLRARARFVIDCTGDGIVADLAGATSFFGEEAATAYGEAHAPAEASEHTMGSSIHFKTVDVGHPVPFEAPEWAARYDDPSFFSTGGRSVKTLASGYWWIEIGPPWHTIYDNEGIRHELTRQVLGLWDYLKNRHPQWSTQAKNLALDWIGQVPGKRESRRLLGEYVLTENDLQENRALFDEVAFGGWYVDLHTPGGLYAKLAEPVTSDLFTEEARSANRGKHVAVHDDTRYVGPYGIPLRTLISSELENLMFAGRDISASHVALGSARVMGTVATMGQAVGTHAADLTGRGVARANDLSRIADLQQTLLRDGCFLPHVANDDPADLARSATVTASSSHAVRGASLIAEDNLGGLGHWLGHPLLPATGHLDIELAQWIAVGTEQRIDSLSVVLVNDSDEPQHVDAAVYAVEGIWDYRTRAGDALRTARLTVPARGEHEVSWPVDLGAGELAGRGYVRLNLAGSPEVEWRRSPAVLPGQLAGYAVSPRRLRRYGGGETLNFSVRPPQHAYAPENVVSGVARPSRGTNVWRSDPEASLPAWIELGWAEPVQLSQVQLTFAGNLLREYNATPPEYRDPQTIRRYDLEARVEGRWTVLASGKDNYVNRVVHSFEPVVTDRLRVTVLETNGDCSAAIYEVRCYPTEVCTVPAYR